MSINNLTIDRTIWNPGKKYSASNLLNFYGYKDYSDPKGKRNQCCLGILGTALGFGDDEINRVNYPITDPRWPKELWDIGYYKGIRQLTYYPWYSIFAIINDVTDVDDEVKESWIACGFKEVLGIDVIFTGKYPPLY